ncbi:hypothetical protein INT47_005154 [Mucor saturninus]|uniref:Uncharacterized protein n=1 Tax=Mucor saturninus TaxID=64648 RepID=A0A8H7QRH1_9FUNG|nr:hypothetical protein INT47_005154 [Mucor saturninus]
MEYYLSKVDVSKLTAEEANSYMFRLKRFFRPPAFLVDTEPIYSGEVEGTPSQQEETTGEEGENSEEQQEEVTLKDQESDKNQVSDETTPLQGTEAQKDEKFDIHKEIMDAYNYAWAPFSFH